MFYALGWHLIGWCHLRNDYRDFRIARITDMEKPFEKKDHVSLGEYMKGLPVEY